MMLKSMGLHKILRFRVCRVWGVCEWGGVKLACSLSEAIYNDPDMDLC